MIVPRTILIDTSIFDKNHYNFFSRWVERFVHLASAKKSTLLLPDPIEREVVRHIKEGSRAAQSAIQKACEKAPLLYRWPKWHGKRAVETAAAEIEAATMECWTEFLKHFMVEKLTYQDINVAEIMDWYDKQQPPFGDGEKRKEFPDAFTIAAVLSYSKRHSLPVAVVSEDGDIKKACALHKELIYYPSLSALTEALVDAEVKAAISLPSAIIADFKTATPLPSALKAAIAANPARVITGIEEAFQNLSFYHEEDLEADVENVEVKSVKILNIRVITIEDGYCTITFDVNMDFSAYVEYGDPDTMVIDSSEDFRMPLFMRAGAVTDSVSISATANLEFDDEWKEILSVDDLEFDRRSIGVDARPPIRYDDHNEEEPSEEDFVPPEHQDPEEP